MTATSQSIQIKNTVPVEYKGYTIRPDYTCYKWRFMFFPKEEGEQHALDYIDGSFINMGNCKWADSIDEAMDAIDDKIAESMPCYTVEMNGRNYPWKWLSDAVGFASKFNGTMNVSFNSI